MATFAQLVGWRPSLNRGWGWLWVLLKDELAPFPGRGAEVARMVISATVVMLLIMTFRIPGAALGAYYALVIPRNGPTSTLKQAGVSALAFLCGTAVALLGAMLFVDSPVTHFLWVVGSLFLTFYLLSVSTVYSAATGFGFLTTIAVSIWDARSPANAKVEATLFTLLSVALGMAVTVAVEYLFAATHSADLVLSGIVERLRVVERMLHDFAGRSEADPWVRRRLHQYAGMGTGHLRQVLSRANYAAEYRGLLGAALSLSGRLIDNSATLSELRIRSSGEDRERLDRLANEIRGMRTHLQRQEVPKALPLDDAVNISESIPLLAELERNVHLLSQAFAGRRFEEHLSLPEERAPIRIFVADALTNTGHLKFAVRGCLAASFCYVLYTAVAWPGLNTALATCLVTALSNVGTSRQKQVLRLAGALIGGCVFGFGAQIFLLPHLDSIAEFAALFAGVTAVAAWIATASPRISYAGLQIALAWYLINLNDFAMNSSLTVVRDRFFGILLGQFAMWLIFDRLWATPAAVEMKGLFVRNLRRIARFASAPLGEETRRTPARLWSERDAIHRAFSTVRSQADAVLFEFRPQRRADLALRDCVRAWQPELRALFMVKLGLLQFRLRASDGALPEAGERAQQLARTMLEALANLVETGDEDALEEGARQAERMIAQLREEEPAWGEESPHGATVLTLSHSLLALTVSLYRNVRGCRASAAREMQASPAAGAA